MSAIFQPIGPTVQATATATSSSVSLNRNSSSTRVYNAGTSVVFVRFTNGASTAVATDTPIPPGIVEVFRSGQADTASVICPSGTATVYFTNGEGA